MKMVKKIAFAGFGMVSLLAPLGMSGIAHAISCDSVEQESCQLSVQATPLECETVPDAKGICDLSIDKQVSINGGLFVEADTSADAAQATVGDTVTWQITVTDKSSNGFTPSGYIYLRDDMPSGFNVINTSASVGTWGVYATDVWSIPLSGLDASPGEQATLTFTTTSTATGLFQNTAFFDKWDGYGCPDGGCVYTDNNPSNNSNDAWVDPSGKPVVLADTTTTTLVNTGSGTTASVIAAGLIVATLAVGASSRFSRKRTYNAN